MFTAAATKRKERTKAMSPGHPPDPGLNLTHLSLFQNLKSGNIMSMCQTFKLVENITPLNIILF